MSLLPFLRKANPRPLPIALHLGPLVSTWYGTSKWKIGKQILNSLLLNKQRRKKSGAMLSQSTYNVHYIDLWIKNPRLTRWYDLSSTQKGWKFYSICSYFSKLTSELPWFYICSIKVFNSTLLDLSFPDSY